MAPEPHPDGLHTETEDYGMSASALVTHRVRGLLTVLVTLVVLLAGCASVQNTPQQDYVWEMGRNCNTTTLYMTQVDSDGRHRVQGASNVIHFTPYFDCMKLQFRVHPYLDWLKARQVAAQPSGGSALAVPAAVAAVSTPTTAPVWQVGDEWQFAYKSPSDSGTYVWTVDRVEMLDGVQHYVIKTATREIFYRTSDLASSLERVDGVVVMRETPPRLMYAWPLTVGKAWDQSHRQERPVDRTTTNRDSLWTVEAEESATVPAGTFRTLKITWRNKNTGALNYEMWYSPEVKQWVKIREILSNGVRERELVSFKLK